MAFFVTLLMFLLILLVFLLFFFFVILFDVFGALDASGLLLFVSVRGFFLMLLAYVWKFFMFMHMLIAFLEILVVFLLMLLAFSWMLLIFFLDVSFGVFDANFCIGVAVAAVLNTPYEEWSLLLWLAFHSFISIKCKLSLLVQEPLLKIRIKIVFC